MMTIKEANERIEKAMLQNGQYSHNICTLVLSAVACDHGIAQANKLVDEWGLTNAYGIKKIKKEDFKKCGAKKR